MQQYPVQYHYKRERGKLLKMSFYWYDIFFGRQRFLPLIQNSFAMQQPRFHCFLMRRLKVRGNKPLSEPQKCSILSPWERVVFRLVLFVVQCGFQSWNNPFSLLIKIDPCKQKVVQRCHPLGTIVPLKPHKIKIQGLNVEVDVYWILKDADEKVIIVLLP